MNVNIDTASCCCYTVSQPKLLALWTVALSFIINPSHGQPQKECICDDQIFVFQLNAHHSATKFTLAGYVVKQLQSDAK